MTLNITVQNLLSDSVARSLVYVDTTVSGLVQELERAGFEAYVRVNGDGYDIIEGLSDGQLVTVEVEYYGEA